MKKPEYPLLAVLEIKRKRVDQAQKVVKEKTEALHKEENVLRKVEEARDKVLNHRDDKKNQMNDTIDAGTTAPEILAMKRYLDIVQEKLAAEEVKVKQQMEIVEQAKKELIAAQEALKEKRKEVEKLEKHQETWEKEARIEMAKAETKEQDELGEMMFLGKKFRRK